MLRGLTEDALAAIDRALDRGASVQVRRRDAPARLRLAGVQVSALGAPAIN